MDWFYAKDGQQNGPVSKEELDGLYQSGQISSGDLVWNDTMADWAPIGSLVEFSAPPETAPPLSSPPPTSSDSSSSGGGTVAAGGVLASASPPPQYTGEKIPSYLWQSIVAILFCCLPAAVVSLVYAVKVDSLVQSGDIEKAKAASRNAKLWFWISFGLGIVIWVFFFGFGAFGAYMEEVQGM